MTVRTKRLILRPWQESDLEPFAQLNADPRVREYFPGILSREESMCSIASTKMIGKGRHQNEY